MDKKRIGVITMHRVANYGSFLQAFATQFIVNKLGYDCELIDYQFPNKWHLKQIHSLKHRIIRWFIDPISPTMRQVRRNSKIIKSYYNRYNLSAYYPTAESLIKNPPQYDIYLTGSDQVWNTTHTLGDSTFMLAFAPKSAVKVAYSASTCKPRLDSDYADNFNTNLASYRAISVREQSSLKQINAVSGLNTQVTLDPALLLSKQEWMQQFPRDKFKGEKYILFYMLDYSFDPKPYIYHLAHELQERTGLKIIPILNIKDKYINEFNLRVEFNNTSFDVDDFISLFANASYVISSSFHGVAFATNFTVPLYAVTPKSNADNRIGDYLKSIELDNSIFEIGREFELVTDVVEHNVMNSAKERSTAILGKMLEY